MKHSIWIVSSCCGWLVGAGIARKDAGILIPSIITIIFCLLIVGGVLNP